MASPQCLMEKPFGPYYIGNVILLLLLLLLPIFYSHTVNECRPGYPLNMGIEFTYDQGISSKNPWVDGIHIKMNLDYGNQYLLINNTNINSDKPKHNLYTYILLHITVYF